MIKARNVRWTSIDPARFFTHGKDEQGTLGPVVIWIGVKSGSTSSEMAHEVSQQILDLLRKSRVEDVVVEWREAEPQTLAGHPLLPHVSLIDASHHVRRFLTALHGVPLATEELEDSQGTLTLWFHENKDEDGNPSDKVFGLSSCHVLHKDSNTEYEFKEGAVKNHVRVCGMRRFQRGLDDIDTAISRHRASAACWTVDIASCQKQVQDPQTAEEIRQCQRKLEEEEEAITDLEGLHSEVTTYWSDIELQRNIGYVQYAPPISVDVGEDGIKYTSDWGVFLATEARVKPEFQGNVVDIGAFRFVFLYLPLTKKFNSYPGSKYAPSVFKEMFHPIDFGPNTFRYPVKRKLRIVGCATEEDLATPSTFDSEGQLCLIVGKDGNTTGLTAGVYAGLKSFARNDAGVESMELGIYNLDRKTGLVFSAKGDSGSLVWHMQNGQAYIVGQIHSGRNKGGSTGNHVTYCTPGWFLLEQVKKKFKYADFYRSAWGA